MRQHLDLFSGIGGFALAANYCGLQTIGFVERDEYCAGILATHWPSVPIHDNIRTFDARPFAGCWLLTGGFPCQPFSNAGLKLGEEDEDRYLWPETLGAIAAARPRWVLLENVAGIINMALDEVLSDLEGEGYETGTVVLPACSKNAPHRRDRVWIIANARKQSSGREGEGINREGGRDNAAADRKTIPNASGEQVRSGEPREMASETGQGAGARNGLGHGGEDVADPSSIGQQGSGEPSRPRDKAAAADRETDRTFNSSQGTPASGFAQPRVGFMAHGIPSEFFGHQGFETEPDIPRVAKGIKNRTNKLKALGNSIVWQVAAEIIQSMIDCEEQNEK
jgi:DNA (cytosine-5)-methyltransferase 1